MEVDCINMNWFVTMVIVVGLVIGIGVSVLDKVSIQETWFQCCNNTQCSDIYYNITDNICHNITSGVIYYGLNFSNKTIVAY